MSDNGYMIWFVATAAMIIAVLTIGTLAAAGLIGRDKSPTRRPTGVRGHEKTPTDEATAATAFGERQLETESGDADRGVHRARAYSSAGRQR
jgi:hypothetical protein